MNNTEKYIVRLVRLEIDNMKNVVHGVIDFEVTEKGSILGIYGQNGSGKTVVVDCMVLLKCLLSGRTIPSRFYYYINAKSNDARVKYCFSIKKADEELYVEYEVVLSKEGGKGFCLSGEKLCMKHIDNHNRTKLTPVFEYQKGSKTLFTPLKYYSYFQKNIDFLLGLGIAQHATENFDEETNEYEIGSFLFAKKAQEVFSAATDEMKVIYFISNILQNYGIHDLEIIETSYYGYLSLNLGTFPVNVDWPAEMKKSNATGIMLNIMDVNSVPKELFTYVEKTIQQINIVLKSLVPGVSLEIYNSFDKLVGNNVEGVQFEVTTVRDDMRIPLVYESAGIKKMISICSNLISCYNREGYCLVVDELDSGIYEFLLGECLEVMQEKAKGQLIFTSHNLRPLEILDNKFLVYTTINPENRYLKTSYIKNTQNKRLSYLRNITLGGQKEQLYNETNIYEIEFAMKRAGSLWNDI